MPVQCAAPPTPGTCPRGFHACTVRWRCPHGYEFLRHTSAGKLVTASAGPEQGPRPCPDCTAQSGAQVARLGDAYLMAELEEALGLVDSHD